MKIEILGETSSTNDYIKRYSSSGEDRIVIAERQTGGRGTKGRSFLSNEGGVYLSALTFYRDMPAKDAFMIMAHAAVAVCRTAEAFSLSPEIKWPNDVYLSGKKLAGILVENALEGGKVTSSIIGIGLNVNNDLGELSRIAVSLSEAAEREIPYRKARDILIENLQRKDSFDDYLKRIRFLDREVCVTQNGVSYFATAVEVRSDGRLEVERNGERILLSAAEISLKI